MGQMVVPVGKLRVKVHKVEVMLDNIIVTGKSDAAHLENIEAVLKRLAVKNLRINVHNGLFFLRRIEYCVNEIAKDSQSIHNIS